jgi:hyperosmotically inducible protein
MKTTTLKLALAAALSVSGAMMLPHAYAADGDSTVGTYVDDATVTTRVKAKFAEDKAVGAMSIGVETVQGVVQLSGFAKSSMEKSQAEKLTRATPGVKSVRNDIVVRPAQQ